ncbi:MAG: ABC transporter ATP-binding protein [Acidimicrobiales bacterium]|nr:ABC transporter ATP-binding protein [Acidimicrobiales bacterium]MYG61988.1 ABC transporter ATP-binding protein [Acidimicrobiales bacterium]
MTGDESRHELLTLSKVDKIFQTDKGPLHVLDQLDFRVGPGEFVCLLGPSGAGKTTLLRAVSGLDLATSGSVRLEGVEVTEPPEHMAFVFQDYSRSLLAWQTVEENVMLPLRRSHNRATQKQKAHEALASVGLAGFETSYPWQLSGGMQQRVAIARALAYDAPLMIMDEPFAAVDAQTRAELQDFILELHAASGKAILFVTHDVDEAAYLSDRIVVLTARPATVNDEIRNDLPKPRDQIVTKGLPRYNQIRAEILGLIKH